MKWFLKCIREYGNFSGRARRKEYWMYHLYYALFVLFSIILEQASGYSFQGYALGPFSTLIALILLIPSLAVSSRRLHDTRKSEACLTLLFLPIFGTLLLTIFFVQIGNQDMNVYGDDPKQPRRLRNNIPMNNTPSNRPMNY